jgi:hypothetical protein
MPAVAPTVLARARNRVTNGLVIANAVIGGPKMINVATNDPSIPSARASLDSKGPTTAKMTP